MWGGGDLQALLHVVAGIAAAGMGWGIVRRGFGLDRNRAFAWLCAALATWNGFYVARGRIALGDALSLVGASAAAPLGLNLALVLVGAPRRMRLIGAGAAAVLAAGTWIALLRWDGPEWPGRLVLVLVGLGVPLTAALVVLAAGALRSRGAERRALLYVAGGGALAVAGGMSDFVPRSHLRIVELGPLGVLLFLLVVFAVLVRYRFFDVDWLVARLVAAIAWSAIVALMYLAVVRNLDADYPELFALTLLVLVTAGPLARAVTAGTRSLLQPGSRLARVLLDVSRELPRATTAEEVWSTIERARVALAADVRLDVMLRRGSEYRMVHRAGPQPEREAPPVPAGAAVPELLARERLPLTRRHVELERDEASHERRRLATRTLAEMDAARVEILVPLMSGSELAGWLALGGALPEPALTAETTAQLLAVSHQATAALDRIEAIAGARRQEALAAAGEIAAGLAHEVRNPVAAIHGAAQALGPMATEQQRKEMLDVIAEESARLGRVVGEFLDYARPSPSRRDPVDLVQLAHQVVRAARLAGRDLRYEIVEPQPAAPAVVGDPDQLHRALDNLVRNAWEAAGPGGRVRISVAGVGSSRVELRVEDDGPGIAPERIPALFRPFSSGRPGGTGLGLAFVERIVDAHGGTIRVEGRPGSGAEFRIELPAAPAEDRA